MLAQQVYGGHGYIAEHGMEQLVRDARIAMIYEGANGIQALDLVGRKLSKDGGRALRAFFGEVEAHIKTQSGNAAMQPYVGPLAIALGHLQQATMWFAKHAIDGTRPGRRRRDRLHASLRTGGARLHVVPHGRGGEREACRRRGRRRRA